MLISVDDLTRLDDEGRVTLMDWERTAGQWQQLAAPDDDIRFAIQALGEIDNAHDVVVAVAVIVGTADRAEGIKAWSFRGDRYIEATWVK